MNKWLKGNGYWCADCRGTGRGKALYRIVYEGGWYCQFYDSCPTCGGDKRIAATEAQVLGDNCPATPPPERHTILSQTIEYGRAIA